MLEDTCLGHKTLLRLEGGLAFSGSCIDGLELLDAMIDAQAQDVQSFLVGVFGKMLMSFVILGSYQDHRNATG